jgi:hypothetical protein
LVSDFPDLTYPRRGAVWLDRGRGCLQENQPLRCANRLANSKRPREAQRSCQHADGITTRVAEFHWSCPAFRSARLPCIEDQRNPGLEPAIVSLKWRPCFLGFSFGASCELSRREIPVARTAAIELEQKPRWRRTPGLQARRHSSRIVLFLRGGNETLEFLEPVLHKDELGDRLRLATEEFGHEEMLPIGGNIPVARRLAGYTILLFEQ